ncbi:MAG: hypothetical protein JXA30_19565 [Deltaproteobacteria bacterium]|nr:hypothetical protein [Deltaproteobacteria bacterium]
MEKRNLKDQGFSNGVGAEPYSTEPARPSLSEAEAAKLFREDRTESHVSDALKHAAILARSRPIRASHVLSAVASSGARTGAFESFAKIVPLKPLTITKKEDLTFPAWEELSEGLRRQFTWAISPKPGDTTTTTIWGRDLITAALLCSDAEVAPVLAQAKRYVDDVRDLWYLFVTKDSSHRSADEWNAWWKAANVSLPVFQHPGYITETDEGTDHLDVKKEAQAFARLILDPNVKAPLSIGLLGDWGSGKSFFMGQIKRQIDKICRNELQIPKFYKKIVPIEFNAWHASDTNLWASLVTHIFDEIWKNVSLEDEEPSEEARQLLDEEIDKAEGAVHWAETRVDFERKALTKAEKDLTEQREKLAWSKYVSRFTRAGIESVAKAAGWRRPLETINDVEEAAQSLADSSSRLRLAVVSLLERPLRHITVPMVIIVLLVGTGWICIDYFDVLLKSKELSKWVVAFVGAIGTLVGPITTASSKVRRLAEKFERIRKEYDECLKEKTATDPEEAERLTKARGELANAESNVRAAKTRLESLLNTRAALDPRNRLAIFLREQIQSTQYRSQQGVISLVRKDFEKLSKFMSELRKSTLIDKSDAEKSDSAEPPNVVDAKQVLRKAPSAEGSNLRQTDNIWQGIVFKVRKALKALYYNMKRLQEADSRERSDTEKTTSEKPRELSEGTRDHQKSSLTEKNNTDKPAKIQAIDRIVLYVDDLDRCRPDHVVHMLEAVHLLLSLDLFIVVVAVDSRWLTRALEVYYKDLLGGVDGRENDGLRASTAQNYLEKIFQITYALAPMKRENYRGYVAFLAGEGDKTAPKDGDTFGSLPEKADAPSQDEGTVSQNNDSRTQVAQLPPSGPVHIERFEQDLICQYMPLLPTPRIAKRLTNVYRLIKASKNVVELEKFKKDERASSCLLMLAILFGRPAIATGLLKALYEESPPFNQPGEKFVDALRRRQPREIGSRYREEWIKLASILKDLGVTLTVEQCAREPLEVARYSLVSGHEWHTWKRTPNLNVIKGTYTVEAPQR